jgi:uncharacterized protein (UPF0333 family)
MKNAQVGIEYIILVSVLLLFLIPVITYALNESALNIRISQLENSLRRVAKGVNTVYALGPGAQEIVTVTLPKGIESSLVQNKSILVTAGILGGISEIHYATVAEVAGSFPIGAGTYRIRVLTMENDTVDVRLRNTTG